MGNSNLFLFALICGCAVLGYGKELGSLFKYCKGNDPNINTCLKTAIKDGITALVNDGPAQYHVQSLEPVEIESASIGKGNGPVNVVQNFKNIELHNLGHGVSIDDVNATITPTNFNVEADASWPYVDLKADYDFNGRILVLPIVGNGKCHIKLHELSAHVVFTGDVIEKKGKSYANVQDVKLTLTPKKVTFMFENLFNGDKRLSDEMHKVLNENWKDVYEDIKVGYEELVAKVLQSISSNVFGRIEYTTLFPKE